MPIQIDLSTEQTRFDLAAMVQEWTDFLESQCGYEKADPALVAILAFEHNRRFHEAIHDEGMCWDDVSGTFLAPDCYIDPFGRFMYSREALDMVWSDCFEDVNDEFDTFEEQYAQERAQGLV
jgi:hypothetical protein